ncbi:WcaF family extracellular polysaccharide biosynthesis acetyltransferase [Aeoliella sp.]|uniref:WcaF family extracellular polysaccharide biosynthesis acetyltransferase n=1 Tax=Aeoliella sp. TaxID=2795800 RepID=UPI003CCB8EB3
MSDNANPSPDSSADHRVAWVDLEHFRVTDYNPGSLPARATWYVVCELLFASALPLPSSWKCALLRCFGAQIGNGVVIKPRVRIKFPWQLRIGDHTWIGEGSWIDNLAMVDVGSHVCISQGTYFCTGSHDHRKQNFDLLTAPITVGDGAWVAARTTLLGGVSVGPNALVAAASMVHKDVPAGVIVGGNPAVVIRDRQKPASDS